MLILLRFLPSIDSWVENQLPLWYFTAQGNNNHDKVIALQEDFLHT